jgi:hypothetical protein
VLRGERLAIAEGGVHSHACGGTRGREEPVADIGLHAKSTRMVRNLFFGVRNCFMGRVVVLFCALLGVSVFAQVPMESTVTLSVSYAPRSSAKFATKTLGSAGLIQQMGLSGGSIVCVEDASDPLGGWTFKHVLPSKVKGGSAVEMDLSDSIGMEVLGYSDVGTYKSASSVAPMFQTTLGRVTRNATVKLRVSPNEGMSFEFLGGVTMGYSVVQRAGTTEAAWVPGAMSFTGAGTSVTIRKRFSKRAYRPRSKWGRQTLPPPKPLSSLNASISRSEAIEGRFTVCISLWWSVLRMEVSKKYEFGSKVSVAVSSKGNWVMGAKSLSGNTYDGHTLSGQLE